MKNKIILVRETAGIITTINCCLELCNRNECNERFK